MVQHAELTATWAPIAPVAASLIPRVEPQLKPYLRNKHKYI